MLRLAILVIAFATLPALAQEKIGKPVRLVVGFAAGGSVGTPDLTERFVKLGLDPAPAGPKATSEQLAADYARWRPIVQQAGFKLD